MQARGGGDSHRRACDGRDARLRLVGISRSLYRYASCRSAGLELRNRIAELAAMKRRYGYRRIHVLLCREGWSVNHKRTYRLYREQGLMVRKRKRKRIGLTERLVLPAVQSANQSWSMDYVADGLIDGRKLRALTIVDDFTRECLAIEVDTSLPGSRVVAVLERLRDLRGLPSSITVDHGPEFEAVLLVLKIPIHSNGVYGRLCSNPVKSGAYLRGGSFVPCYSADANATDHYASEIATTSALE